MSSASYLPTSDPLEQTLRDIDDTIRAMKAELDAYHPAYVRYVLATREAVRYTLAVRETERAIRALEVLAHHGR
jgi:hypothetical protein